MERLTKSGTISGKNINELLDESNENQMCKTKAYYKLQEYEDLEEQGRLIKLPCKVGDTVYHVVQGRIVEVSNVDLFFLLLSVAENRFNNSVFLTKSEAEQKLKEMERD